MTWGPKRITAGVTALVILALLALNVSGVFPLPAGPLGVHQGALPDIARSTVNYDPQRTALYLSPLVENTGPVPVTIVRITPVGTTVPDSVEILGSLPFNSDDPKEELRDGTGLITLGVQDDPGPGWAKPQSVTGVTVDPKGSAQHQGRAFLARINPDPAQITTVLRFDVEYTIGPFRFVTTAWGPVGTTVVVCPRDRPMAVEDGECGRLEGDLVGGEAARPHTDAQSHSLPATIEAP
jgi:hypothetical protein